MPTFTMEGTEAAGHVDRLVPDVAVELSVGALVSREQVESELDTMLTAIRQFWNKEPDQVMCEASAMSARCTELCVHLLRVESRQREFRQIRTLQVTPILVELDRQFKFHSRMVEMRRQDLELMR